MTQRSPTLEPTEPLSTATLSVSDWADLLRLWLPWKNRIYANHSIPEFIKVIHIAAGSGTGRIARCHGRISYLCIWHGSGDTISVECVIGDRRLFLRDRHRIFAGYKSIFMIRRGKLRTFKLLSTYGSTNQ